MSKLRNVPKNFYGSFIKRNSNLESRPVEGTDVAVMQTIEDEKVVAQAIYRKGVEPVYQITFPPSTDAEIESGELILNHTYSTGEVAKYYYIPKPSHSNFQPVIIDSLGEYRTRDGRRAVVTEIKKPKYKNEEGVMESLAKGTVYTPITKNGKTKY